MRILSISAVVLLHLVVASCAPGQTRQPSTASLRKTTHSKDYVVVFSDTFQGNTTGWSSRDDKDAYLQVTNGSYVISHKRGEGSWLTFASIGLRPDDDFRLETTIKKIDGPLSYGYGLLWGSNNNPREYFTLMISGKGKYSVGRMTKEGYSVIIDWTKCTVINGGNEATNTLAIEHAEDSLSILINDSAVASIKYTRPNYARCGFIVYNKQTIEVKNISLQIKM